MYNKGSSVVQKLGTEMECNLVIDGTNIGRRFSPYVIAEMSGNHQNSLEIAMQLMRECAASGVNAFKLQTYSAQTLTLESNRAEYIVQSGPWQGRTLFDLYSQGHTPNAWLKPLFELARDLNLTLFSTPFGIKEVDLLEELGVSLYKIASFEITYTQLLKKIASTGKPVIFSTGLATLDEIAKAIDVLQTNGSGQIAILKCTTSYPAEDKDLNLSTINYLKNRFDVPVGFSDHTKGINAAITAVGAGACIFEKHVKLDSDVSSVDSSFALSASQLAEYISNIHTAYNSMGEVQDGPTYSEKQYLKYRRSIVAARDILAGELISEDKVTIIRPNIGLQPELLDSIIGLKVKRNICFGEGITFENLET
jgi:N-acetylneuraminate synthase